MIVTPDLVDEVKFLRYFYKNVDVCLGPSSGEIYDELKRLYEEPLPRGYELHEEEEDE